jgi:nesprin-1
VSDKEEGLHMLQISLDNLQIVLPNTSVAGRDTMRREMQGLQSEYDCLSADINDLKSKLDSTLTQWTVYDDSIEQLSRWLRDLEDQLQAESHLQNTLQEKKLQLERVKVNHYHSLINVNHYHSLIKVNHYHRLIKVYHCHSLIKVNHYHSLID